jgi:hypothetical protein
MQSRIDKMLSKMKVETEIVLPASYGEETTKEILIVELCEQALGQRFDKLCMCVEIDKKFELATYHATAYLLSEYEVRALIRYARMKE